MSDPTLVVTPLSTAGLSQPTTMAFLGPNDILVLEKATGRVRRVLNGTILASPVLDVAVSNNSERGLLGIAIQAGAPPRVFLYYTESTVDGGSPLGNRVYRYDWNAGTGTLINPLLVLDLPVTAGPNHDGGIILLDSANRLYVVIGDLNRNGQLQNFPAGPLPDDTGVVLRVNTDGSAAAGNPFTPYCSVTTTTTCASNANCPSGQTCLTQVARYYAYGVRNSFGMTLDPVTGALWDTENGASTYDEINLIAPGFNSGWEALMGPESRTPGHGPFFNMPGGASAYSDPAFSWLSTVAPTGIFFPYATTWGPGYNDTVLAGDNNFGNIYAFPLNPARDGFVLTGGLADLVADTTAERNQVRIGQGFGVVTDIKKGPDDHVYVVSLSQGAIYRIAGTVPVELQSFSLE
jgi:glucose/arabinose dehydrogenase